MAGEEIVNNDDGDLVIQRSLVSYLDGIQQGMAAGFAEMRTAMAGKADKADLVRIEDRLEEHGRQISELNAWKHDQGVVVAAEEKRSERWWNWKRAIGATLGGSAGLAAVIIAPHLH